MDIWDSIELPDSHMDLALNGHNYSNGIVARVTRWSHGPSIILNGHSNGIVDQVTLMVTWT